MYPVTNSIVSNIDSYYINWIETQAGRLITPEMSINDQENIISLLLEIPIEKVEFLVNEALRFINSNDCNLIILRTLSALSALSALSYSSHEHVKFLVDQTLRLLDITRLGAMGS